MHNQPLLLGGRACAPTEFAPPSPASPPASPCPSRECDRYAVAIDSWIQGGVDDYHAGNVSAAVSDFNYANALESDGMDAGCFFQY